MFDAKPLYHLALAAGDVPVGSVWEGDYKLPVVLKNDARQGERSLADIGDTYLSSSVPGVSVPLRQVADVEPVWSQSKIVHRNGMRCITVSADLKRGVNAMRMTSRINEVLKNEIALPAGVGLSVMAGPILHLLYPARPEEAAAAAWHLSVLGVASVFVCLMVASSGILQAYGREKLPVWTLLAGGAVKIAASIALVSRPDIGIHGAPISTLLCYGLIAALNLGTIRRSIPAQVRLGEIFGKPLVMTAVMAVTARAVYGLLSRAAGNGVAVLGAIALAALVYGVLAVALGAVRREDLLALPKGEKIADKLHLR